MKKYFLSTSSHSVIYRRLGPMDINAVQRVLNRVLFQMIGHYGY